MPSRIQAFINPELLRWARESIHMDAHQAAAKIGVSPDRLADWEDGADRPSMHQLRRASEVYKRPLAAFYLPNPPRDFHVPHDFRRVAGKHGGELSPEMMIELRRVQFNRATAVELTDNQDYPVRALLGSVRVNGTAHEIATRVRSLLGVSESIQAGWQTPYTALNAWKDAIERLGVLVFHFERVDVSEARGLSVADYPLPFIALNGRDSPRARVFTLIHEFCHLMSRTSGICDTAERTKVASPDDEVEAFCNRVAGEALVPRQTLLDHPAVARHGSGSAWTPAELGEIADFFKVSREVVLRRLLHLERTTRSFYEKFRRDLAARQPRRQTGPMPYSRRILRRVGQPFARIVIGAYYSERITGNELAEYLGARLKYLPKIESLLEGGNTLTGGDG